MQYKITQVMTVTSHALAFVLNVTDIRVVVLCQEQLMQGRLRCWAVKHKITQAVVTDLLSVLRTDHPSLPQDARTLLRRATSHDIVQICGGEYLHFPLQEEMCKKIDVGLELSSDGTLGHTISLAFNVDGMPLF
jgi:hypothetical protein